jgi:thiosulfate dehydrogenase [quinone] large subunit
MRYSVARPATVGARFRRRRERAAFRTAEGLVRRVIWLRLGFGVVWALDAYLKWKPDFISQYGKDVAAAASGQPELLRPWFRFWRHLVAYDPHAFAYATAAIETLIAVGLLLGLGRRVLYVAGTAWSLAIWTIPEGFGGSFVAGATDIGTAIMYGFVFLALYSLETLPATTHARALDRVIERRVRWWSRIAEPGGATAASASEPPRQAGPSRERSD